jgi:hypothetical protein
VESLNSSSARVWIFTPLRNSSDSRKVVSIATVSCWGSFSCHWVAV